MFINWFASPPCKTCLAVIGWNTASALISCHDFLICFARTLCKNQVKDSKVFENFSTNNHIHYQPNLCTADLNCSWISWRSVHVHHSTPLLFGVPSLWKAPTFWIWFQSCKQKSHLLNTNSLTIKSRLSHIVLKVKHPIQNSNETDFSDIYLSSKRFVYA